MLPGRRVSGGIRRLAIGFGLTGKLSRRIGGSILVLMLIANALSYWQASNMLRSQVDNTAWAQAREAAAQVDGYLQTAARLPSQVSRLVTAVPNLPQADLQPTSARCSRPRRSTRRTTSTCTGTR